MLDAYYGGAIDVPTLRSEQERISREARQFEQRMAGIDATLGEWQEILEIAFRFAANCNGAYKSAGDRSRKLFNQAVFEQLLVRDGSITEVRYRAPFGHIFGVEEFEQRSMVDPTLQMSNTTVAVEGPKAMVTKRHRTGVRCR